MSLKAGPAAGRAYPLPARVGATAAAVPAWAWLTALVAVSAAARFAIARHSPAPWIFVDELIYSELSKSFAGGHGLEIRDVPTSSYGFLYPVIVSPAWAFFENVPHAYAAAKAINSLVMSLAAVPAYLLARRFVGRASSLAVAVLTVAVPSLFYTGTIMTENAFYPAFLLAVLAIVLALERPTASRQLWALAACGLAFVVRVQAVALVAALATAIVVLALLEGGGARAVLYRLRAYWTTWGILGGAALLVVLVQLARDQPVTQILGAYRAAGSSGYSVREVAKWFLWHVAELDLYVAVLPFAAFLLVGATAVRRTSDRSNRIYLAAAAPTLFWLALLVAAFASQPSVQRIEERNLFYVAPLLFVALLVWVEGGPPRPRWLAVAAAVVAGALPATIPYFGLINVSAVSDTLTLLPLWNLEDHFVSGHHVRLVVSLCAAAVGILFLILPRRAALAAPALVLLYFAVITPAIGQRIRDTSTGSLFAGIRTERSWIDDALPDGAEAAAVWTGQATPYTIWQNEFFNRSVGDVYYTAAPLPGNLPETPLAVDPASGLLSGGGEPLESEYALADGSFPLVGSVVARDPGTGMTVYRTHGQLRLAARISGIYPSDNWSGGEVAYTRLRCDGGNLRVTLTSDPNLFSNSQLVTAFVGGKAVARTALLPNSVDVPLVVPLRPSGGACVARFTISPTAVPDDVIGNGDTRALGTHFTSFVYTP